MALVNDAINDVKYVVNNVSSSDLSSPENCGVSASSGNPQANFDHHKEFVYYPSDHHQTVDNTNSLLNFGSSNGSFMNFGQNGQQPVNVRGDYSVFPEGDHLNYGYNFWNNPNSFETSTAGFGNVIDGTGKDWLFSDATVVTTGAMQESLSSDSASALKRPATGEIKTQAFKKQCTGSTGKSKNKMKASSKDPQSTAAKIRRERISERLKILQELVPNGNKVDLVTMLEKAVGYVKFLQLQVKVLATDEFWPVQGGKAPDISQVKEAIDAILSSQKPGASNSKSDQS